MGATLHIEPNDTPRAGEEVLAWFALTKKGGQTLPLSSCDCQVELYAQSDQATPIAALTPQAVDSEGYQGIPGVEFTFPDVGAYTLVISGSPKNEGEFSPFELAFDVTVAAGKRVPEPSQAADTNQDEVDNSPTADVPSGEVVSGQRNRWVGIGLVSVAVLGAIAVKWKQRS